MMYTLHAISSLYIAQYRYVNSLTGWGVALSTLIHPRCTVYMTVLFTLLSLITVLYTL